MDCMSSKTVPYVGLVAAMLSTLPCCLGSERDVLIGEPTIEGDGIVWVDPVTGGCPDRMRPGGCGLRGICIECVAHDECPKGNTCYSNGRCHDGYLMAGAVCRKLGSSDDVRQCSTPSSSICRNNAQCGPGDVCAGGRCRQLCVDAYGCGTRGEFCDGEGYCDMMICPPEGECPARFHAVEGSYYCFYDGDSEQDGGSADGGEQ